MTIRQAIEEALVNTFGLWPDEATAVMDDVMARADDPALRTMAERWNDQLIDYPPTLLPVVLLSVRKIARIWLDEHKPMHFAKALLS